GREGWSFDDPEPVGGSRYREGDDPALIQIGGGRFVVVDRELEGPGVGVLVGVERPVLHRDVHDVVVVAERVPQVNCELSDRHGITAIADGSGIVMTIPTLQPLPCTLAPRTGAET